MLAHSSGLNLIRQVKGQLSQIDTRSVFEHCVRHLNAAPENGYGWYEKQPFLYFLMLKWAVQSFKKHEARRKASKQEVLLIARDVWEATAPFVEPNGNLYVFMRRIAFQQFWYQRSFSGATFGRQALLFGEIMRDKKCVAQFQMEVGVSIADFVTQLAHMVADAGVVLGMPHFIRLRPRKISRASEQWARVTACFKTTLEELHERLAPAMEYNTPPELELCEQSPLVRTPFVRGRNGQYELLHYKVLLNSIESAIYDLMRSKGAEIFMREFSGAFEEYVGRLLRECGCEIVAERDLKKRLRGRGKCVDFTLVFEDALVLVDAKGIEGHYDELYHHQPSVITNKLKTTALHAIDQAVETIRRLPTDLVRTQCYFICVTYKQMNLGHGDALRDLTKGTEEWASDRWGEPMLPTGHIFVPSIDELELLIATVRSAGTSLPNVLRKIVSRNTDPQTSHFLLETALGIPAQQFEWPAIVADSASRLCGISPHEF